eukprot:XP_011681354.1 PREDICTED: uncharacterized protein LOC105446354 [Strongylocentrotus purpuratus]
MPGDQGPMFKHGLKHPLDDGIYSYQLKHGHFGKGKVHRRRRRHRHQSHHHHSEGIRLQTAATMSKRSDQLAPLNDLNINLRINTTPNHHRHVISDEATLAPKDTFPADGNQPGAGSGFVPFSMGFPKENNAHFENKYAYNLV